MFVEVSGNMLGDELAALLLDEVLQPWHVDISVDDGRDVLVRVDDAGLLAHSVLRDQEWVALEARDLDESYVRLDQKELERVAHLGLLNLQHLLVFFRVLLNLLVEEEVGDAKSDSMPFLAIGRVLLLQLLEQLVAC